MGSYSSGPPLVHVGTVEQSNVIDIGWLRRQDVLQPGAFLTLRWSRGEREIGSIGAWLVVRDGEERVSAAVLIYRAGSEPHTRDVQETVPVVWTPCRYGGARPWFVCHGGDFGRCGRRVLKLHLRRESLFLCRQCADLTYESQRESSQSRALSRAQTIRKQLGGSASMVEPFPKKPKGMHWTTYERLYAHAEAADQQHLVWLEAWLRRSDRRIARMKQRHRR